MSDKKTTKFEKGRFLIEYIYGFGNKALKVGCITEVSSEAVKIKWEGGDAEWVYKSDFQSNIYSDPKYRIIEKLKP